MLARVVRHLAQHRCDAMTFQSLTTRVSHHIPTSQRGFGLQHGELHDVPWRQARNVRLNAKCDLVRVVVVVVVVVAVAVAVVATNVLQVTVFSQIKTQRTQV